VRGHTVLKEIPSKRVMEVGGCGIMEVLVMVGNPTSRMEGVTMDHVCGEGVLDMFGDVLSDNTGVVQEVVLE
jgi:hypothetical protein